MSVKSYQMIEAGIKGELQTLFWNVNKHTQKRATGAEPVRLLSGRNDRTVELVVDVNGNKFVRRTYAPRAIGEVAHERGSTFESVWEGMNTVFSQAGISIVPSFILSASPDQVVVVSNYLEDARPVIVAPTDKKEQLAEGLGRVVGNQSNDFFPELQMLLPDAFHTTKGGDGQDTIMLTDVDPYPNRASGFLMKQFPKYRDGAWGQYIRHVSELFYDHWCREEEKEGVLEKFLQGVVPGIKSEASVDNIMKTAEAINNTHMLQMGIDMRIFR